MAAGRPAVGIYMATTNSCVAVWQHNRVEIILNDQGDRITPSYVSFTETERLVGDRAKNIADKNPTNTVFDMTKLIGRKFSDPLVQSYKKHWPFKVICGPKDKPMIEVTHRGQVKEFTAEDISSMVLAKMKEFAEAFLGVGVQHAVITVPVYFDNFQRLATEDAGTSSGLNVLYIIDEPIAAAVAYGLNKKYCNMGAKNVLIFHFGRVRTIVTLLTIENSKFQVKAISGNTRLGGEDLDSRIVNYFVQKFKKKHKKDITNSPRALGRLRRACEKGKSILSSATETHIGIDCLYDGIDVDYKLTRANFEELNKELFGQCIGHVEKCLENAKISQRSIHDVVLVGGSTRIPKLQQLLQDFFYGKELCKSITPEETVAHGAAILAANSSGESPVLLDVVHLVQAASMSVEVNENLQASVPGDVTLLSLGMSINQDEMLVLIPRNTSVPTKKEVKRTTGRDNQTSLVIEVYVGERPRTSDNILLGTLVLYGIPPAPRGVHEIHVCLDVDAHGTLHVSAEDKTTRKQSSVTIDNYQDMLSEDEIARMLEEAERFKLKDEELKKNFESLNLLKNYVYDTRATVLTKKLALEKIEGEIKHAVEWLDELKVGKADVIEDKRKQLERRWDPIITKL